MSVALGCGRYGTGAILWTSFGRNDGGAHEELVLLCGGVGAVAMYLGATRLITRKRQASAPTPNGRRQKDQFLVRAPILRQPGPQDRPCPVSAAPIATLMRSGVPILRTLEIVASASGKVQVEDACTEIAKQRQPGRPGLRDHGGQSVLPADDEAHGEGR